ncbi:MAG TPA: TssQ family T6SS-associated lipoprotein [Ideonella sp.]|jgi:Tfp pilus assembly protein PilF|nr:TssQ family T6SS-associated lipoprotein [Ideonella sp.]
MTRTLRFPARPWALATLACVAALMAGCVAPTAQPSVSDAFDRPAERNLLLGLRAYDEAQYPEAERALNEALRLQLSTPRDRATAHKTLAFIYCTSGRRAECEAAFRAARTAEPSFALNKAEAGHPVWGPVYEASRK